MDYAIQTLSTQAMTLANVTSAGRSVERVRDAWLDWWSQTNGQLRTIFADSELADDLFRTQIEVQRLTEHGQPYIFIDSVNRVWKDRLEDVVARLRQLKRFAARQGEIIVLDTSALIEGDDLNGEAWRRRAALASESTIRVIVPVLVIEELDELKHHHSQRVKERARAVLRSAWASQPSADGTMTIGDQATAEILFDEPWHVRRSVNDVEIVERAQMVKDVCGRRVTLAAADYAMLFRAREVGLNALVIAARSEARGTS